MPLARGQHDRQHGSGQHRQPIPSIQGRELQQPAQRWHEERQHLEPDRRSNSGEQQTLRAEERER